MSEQADVMPKLDGNSTSRVNFRYREAEEEDLARALKGQQDNWIFVLGTMAIQLSPGSVKIHLDNEQSGLTELLKPFGPK